MTNKIEYKCPYCGSKVRCNTKYYSKLKQAGCTNLSCQAKGPLAYTAEGTKEIFCERDFATQQSS